MTPCYSLNILVLKFVFIIYFICGAILFDDSSVQNLLHTLIEEDAKGAKVIDMEITKKSLAVDKVATAVDQFLSPRPWWFVTKEPYKWMHEEDKSESLHLVLNRFPKEYELIFRRILETQYPTDCDKAMLRMEVTGGFDSFGNWWSNYLVAKSFSPWAVFTPYMVGAGVSFLDDKACPHTKNRYLCAFLPATNCSLPDDLNSGRSLGNQWTSAGKDGKLINNKEYLANYTNKYHNRAIMEGIMEPIIKGKRSSGLYKLSRIITQDTNANTFQTLFAYGFLYRPNHHFRALIGRMMNKFKKEVKTPFPSNYDCIATIIRRTDRAVGGEDIFAWCKNNTNHENYLDLGCQTDMPFSAITLAHAINASQAISKSKNILVNSDASEWLKTQIENYNLHSNINNLNIFGNTPPPNHRKSTEGGAQYMTAIELSRQCKGLVGHTGSAVTNFFHNILCVRHADTFGTCPHLYDFSQG